MTNKERQEQLDKKKWLESEKAGHDMGGKMQYCCKCEWQICIDYGKWCCGATNGIIQEGLICAKAYNRLYDRKGRAKK